MAKKKTLFKISLEETKNPGEFGINIRSDIEEDEKFIFYIAVKQLLIDCIKETIINGNPKSEMGIFIAALDAMKEASEDPEIIEKINTFVETEGDNNDSLFSLFANLSNNTIKS